MAGGRRPETMAKRARELAVREKRAEKLAKKQAAAAAKKSASTDEEPHSNQTSAASTA